MRILQLIDSLESGGAERMAVNYANSLSEIIPFSGIVSTRKGGPLSEELAEKVSYLFLNKKKAFDVKAILHLRRFVFANNIDIIHAHSSSFFTAILLKITFPSLKIVWHDHYGQSEFLKERKYFVLKLCSLLFSGIIAVNHKLKSWAIDKLHCKNVTYLPNFVTLASNDNAITFLNGNDGKRLICLANLRPQKNHLMLLEVASLIKKEFPDWSFHLVGKDFKDNYSQHLKDEIEKRELVRHVFYYGSRIDIGAILSQCDIGILTSFSEGLPVSLLEYGYHKKAVVATAVGDIPLVIKTSENGFLSESNDVITFYNNLKELILDDEKRLRFGEALFLKITKNYTSDAVISKYINFLKSI